MPFARNIPYNELPDLPPQQLVETHQVLKKAIEAHKALSELKQIGHRLPNQSLLIHSLGLQEAKMSSEIEKISVLHGLKKGREKYYLNHGLLHLLTK